MTLEKLVVFFGPANILTKSPEHPRKDCTPEVTSVLMDGRATCATNGALAKGFSDLCQTHAGGHGCDDYRAGPLLGHPHAWPKPYGDCKV